VKEVQDIARMPERVFTTM